MAAVVDPRLVAATGATIHVHRDAEVAYPHEPFDDGWELKLGALRVRALHTPGRPEHTAFALVDTARGDEPWAVLTGDSLFVGDVRGCSPWIAEPGQPWGMAAPTPAPRPRWRRPWVCGGSPATSPAG